MRTFQNLLLTAAVCALAVVSAQASSLSLVFDPATLSANPGETVTVRGTITNTDTAVVDLNLCSVTLPGAFSTDACAAFFDPINGAPLFLNAGDSATVDLFTFTPDTPFPGPFGLQPAGSFTILGGLEVNGYDPNTQNDLLDAPFQVAVVPEPATLALLALALPFAYGLRRRRV